MQFKKLHIFYSENCSNFTLTQLINVVNDIQVSEKIYLFIFFFELPKIFEYLVVEHKNDNIFYYSF